MMSAVGDAVHVLPVINGAQAAFAERSHHVGLAARARDTRPRTPLGRRDHHLSTGPTAWRAFADIRRELATADFQTLVIKPARSISRPASSRRSRARDGKNSVSIEPAPARLSIGRSPATRFRRTRCSTCRISTSSSSPRSMFRQGAGGLGSRSMGERGAPRQRAMLVEFRSPSRVDRRRDEQSAEGLGCPSAGPRSSMALSHDFGMQPLLVRRKVGA